MLRKVIKILFYNFYVDPENFLYLYFLFFYLFLLNYYCCGGSEGHWTGAVTLFAILIFIYCKIVPTVIYYIIFSIITGIVKNFSLARYIGQRNIQKQAVRCGEV